MEKEQEKNVKINWWIVNEEGGSLGESEDVADTIENQAPSASSEEVLPSEQSNVENNLSEQAAEPSVVASAETE